VLGHQHEPSQVGFYLWPWSLVEICGSIDTEGVVTELLSAMFCVHIVYYELLL
jgi:hypothetical protein